uniref:Uncharacterized protein n=1 Tax=Arundo donax TaxID=35708 RepID=A0A0A9GVQ2_ARUDO
MLSVNRRLWPRRLGAGLAAGRELRHARSSRCSSTIPVCLPWRCGWDASWSEVRATIAVPSAVQIWECRYRSGDRFWGKDE